ncbi:MAG TPA: hypothetical protein VGS80_18575, partial [Ktedonobacterales bacterium]|nr:hypothetical protein [Ktedonobacterales bacterium]
AALRAEPGVTLDRKPRMADFALWGVAIEQSQGWPAGGFLRTYAHEREQANEVALEASPIALSLIAWIKEQPDHQWEGSAGQLRDELMQWVARDAAARSGADTKVTLPHGWPRNPRAMTGALDRVRPNLRNAGVTIIHGKRTERSRTLIIAYAEKGPEPSGPSGPSSRDAEPDSMRPEGMTVPASDDGPTVSSNGDRHAANPHPAWDPDGPDGPDGPPPASANGHDSAFARRLRDLEAAGITGDVAIQHVLAEKGALPARNTEGGAS